MTEISSEASEKRISTLDVVASSFLLFALAVALPLLDLLGRNAAFFVIRDSPTIDIVGLAVLVTLVVPLILAAFAVLAGRVNSVAGAIIHGAIFILLGSVLALSILRRTPVQDLSGWLQILIAGSASAAIYVSYLRIPSFRLGVRWTWMVPIAVLGLFLFASSSSQLILGSPAGAASETVEVRNPAPVVFIIFDALPISDLMDADGNLQADLYPNFARLAGDGTWYRNAITLHPGTEKSVPTILSGIVATDDQVPLLSDHPNNLFTLLDDTYEMTAAEPITELCPEEDCQERVEVEMAPIGRWQSLTSDLRVIAGHLFLPEDLAAGLPPIDDTWGGFDAQSEVATSQEVADASEEFDVRVAFRAALANDRRKSINGFVDSIDADDGPNLRFLHAVVPHAPWNYLPTGQLSDLPEGRLVSRNLPEGWVDDPWRIEQVRQLHLIQVQYADTVLGQILDRLVSSGTYDESVIVVIADHGETFRPGMPRLRDRAAVIEDVIPIPLFIKAPHQESGEIDDYRAYTTDVIPTLAAILGIDLPWAPDGTSLISPARPARTTSEVKAAEGVVEFPGDISIAKAHAAERIERFGSAGPFGLAPVGYADLLDADVGQLRFGEPADAQLALRDPARWTNVDTSADVLPVSVRGRLDGSDSSDVVIAIALNGKIVAVTRSYLDANDDIHFDAMIPPATLRDGENHLELLLVSGVGGDRTFHRLG